jgi:hypothetical protein
MARLSDIFPSCLVGVASIAMAALLLLSLLRRLYMFGVSDAKVAEAVEDVEAMVLSRSDEHRRANSRASIQQRPAELLGALKMQWDVGRG